MRIINQRDKRVIASDAEVARSLTSRLIGLIGRRKFAPGSALIIPALGGQIHTFFMRFPIDVALVDARDKVLCVREGIKPYRISSYCRSAAYVVELPSGTASACGLKPGDTLLVEGWDE